MSTRLKDKLPPLFHSIVSAHNRHAVRVQLGRDQAASVNAVTAALIETASSGRRTASKKHRQIARR